MKHRFLSLVFFTSCYGMEEWKPEPTLYEQLKNFLVSRKGVGLFIVSQIVVRYASSNETLLLLYDVANVASAMVLGSLVTEKMGQRYASVTTPKNLPTEISIDTSSLTRKIHKELRTLNQ